MKLIIIAALSLSFGLASSCKFELSTTGNATLIDGQQFAIECIGMGCNHLILRKEGDQNENEFMNKWCTPNFTMALQMIQCSVDISLSLNGSKLLCLSIDVPQHISSLSILVTQLVTQSTIAMDSVTFNDLMSSTFITPEVIPTVLSPSPPSTPIGSGSVLIVIYSSLFLVTVIIIAVTLLVVVICKIRRSRREQGPQESRKGLQKEESPQGRLPRNNRALSFPLTSLMHAKLFPETNETCVLRQGNP